ncbi:sodium channel modifier 1 [Rhipicephalus sanguineus]|uniref:sodium channel modifier 1 n=1 Tax=Rhipicephalus sanguineus TaxID=34632 RepID=UPI0018943F17|nr:sodium channel modifier 1 [Rhipicephalus sanguineus]
MAFKREGTDTALLQDLQKRRVSEILVSHIPEDEALLLKNGKYACTLCPHRPVLDTIEMLAMHRKGKRHLINLTRHLSHTKWKERELQKRLQEANTASGTVATSFDRTKLLGSAPVKATKKAPRLKLMKSAPYSSCCKKKGGDQEGTGVSGTGEAKTPAVLQNTENPLVKAYIKKTQLKNSFTAVVEQSKRSSTTPSSTNLRLDGSSQKCDDGESIARPRKAVSKGIKKDLTEEEAKEKAKAQYFLNLRMSGWKLDKDGKWVKDENVEFDSDEEEPPPFVDESGASIS